MAEPAQQQCDSRRAAALDVIQRKADILEANHAHRTVVCLYVRTLISSCLSDGRSFLPPEVLALMTRYADLSGTDSGQVRLYMAGAILAVEHTPCGDSVLHIDELATDWLEDIAGWLELLDYPHNPAEVPAFGHQGYYGVNSALEWLRQRSITTNERLEAYARKLDLICDWKNLIRA